MSQDITGALDGWDFDPHELNVRIIKGDDDQEKIQMRIDLGLLQMSLNGRPDGQRPHGFESALDFYIQEAKDYGEGYALSAEALDELFREGLQYYHRYLCLFHLNHYDLVVRDTKRNLGLFRFVVKNARKRRDQWRFDQYRPYVLMMNTRAKAMLALEDQSPADAISNIEDGCRRIREYLNHYSRSEDECFELDFLQRWMEELQKSGRCNELEVERLERPRSGGPVVPPPVPTDEKSLDADALRSELHKAVEREEYERAASIRDILKRIEQAEKRDSA